MDVKDRFSIASPHRKLIMSGSLSYKSGIFKAINERQHSFKDEDFSGTAWCW